MSFCQLHPSTSKAYEQVLAKEDLILRDDAIWIDDGIAYKHDLFRRLSLVMPFVDVLHLSVADRKLA